MSGITRPNDLFDCLALFLQALEKQKFSNVEAYGQRMLMLDADYVPETRAQAVACCFVANYLLLGINRGDLSIMDPYASVSDYSGTANHNDIVINPAVPIFFDPEKSKENLQILEDFFMARDLDVEHDRSLEVVFGPVPSEYMIVMEQAYLALNLFDQNSDFDEDGNVLLQSCEQLKAKPMEHDEFAIIASRANVTQLLKSNSFDPYKNIKALSAFGHFDLTGWGPDMRMS